MTNKFEGSLPTPETPKAEILKQFLEESRIMDELAASFENTTELSREERQKLDEFKNKRMAIIKNLKKLLGLEG